MRSGLMRVSSLGPACWRDYPRTWRSRRWPLPSVPLMMIVMTTAHDQGHALLPDFTQRSFDLDGTSKTVYVSGEGPAVVLLPEMPGISPDLVRLARWIRTLASPSIFRRCSGSTARSRRPRQGSRSSGGRASVPNSGRSPAVERAPSWRGSGPSAPGARGVRGSRRRCGRSVLHRKLRAHDDAPAAGIAPVVNHPSLPLDDPGVLEMTPTTRPPLGSGSIETG